MSDRAHDEIIHISRFAGRVSVHFAGRVVADTTRALALHEAGHKVVYYVPRADAHMHALVRSPHSSRCPHKGTASYFSLDGAGAQGENIAWSYEDPLPAAREIKDHLAFYGDRCDVTAAPTG